MPDRTYATSLARAVACALVACAGVAQAQTLSPSGVRAVPTYEAAGLYWSGAGAGADGCDVRFRVSGASEWTQGLAMVLDPSNGECRGSLVNLAAGTDYEAQLGVGGSYTRGIAFTTWANAKPVARTVRIAGGSGTFNVAEGGSAAGYVVYDGTGATLDAGNGAASNVTINASYVIVRGLTLRGAQQHAILIAPTAHDVIVEDNDIAGWGRTRDGQWGTDMDSAVRAICSSQELERVTIQRNRIHDPRYSANSWTDGHPAGPQGITFSYCGGNHVIRWNEFYSTGGNRFNDAMGGEDNFSTTGFPNRDSDIYGNRISHTWDDGIEAEGGNQNVRIWGNYLDLTATGIATTVTSIGPVYIFRNVFNRNQFYANRPPDTDDRQPFFKSGSSADFGNGRRYLFHNTMLQASDGTSLYGLGGGAGVGGTGATQLVRNTVSMNNIWHLWKANSAVYQVGSDNSFRNDMFNGRFDAAIVGGINATPKYAGGHGWVSESGGLYQLAAGTPGYDGGVRIANFNDGFLGAAPDVGAAEAGAPAMAFGIAAASGASVAGGSGAPTGPTGSTGSTGPTGSSGAPASGSSPQVSPDPAGSGRSGAKLGLDSSSYASNVGQGVTLSAMLSGTSGSPTGTVVFRDNGVAISGCNAIRVAGGTATCTLGTLAAGSHAISGAYSGDSVYAAGIAGPITQTVKAAATTFESALNVHGMWWGSASESGWGMNVAQQGDVLFATWYTYDGSGRAQWYAMTSGTKTAPGTWSGTLYRATGPAYSEAAFDPSRVTLTAAGSGTLAFGDSDHGTFTATVDGVGVMKPITRHVFGAQPVCSEGGDAASSTNYQDLWWRASGAEPGWGLSIAHEGDVLFVTWYTYDANGQGTWFVASSAARAADGSYDGTLYRAAGPALGSAAWDPTRVALTPVGSVSLAFSDGASGIFRYTVDGFSGSRPITRDTFSTPPTVCH